LRVSLAFLFLLLQIIAFSLKVLAAAMCVFVTNYKWLSVGLGVCALLLTLSHVRWVGDTNAASLLMLQLAEA
jgi:hypothetical protein